MKRKHWFWILIVIVAAGFVWLALAPKVIDVEAATVVRAPLRVTVDEEGETRLRRRFPARRASAVSMPEEDASNVRA